MARYNSYETNRTTREDPPVSARATLGSVTGTVAQLETGDALQGAVVTLTPSDIQLQSQSWRVMDSKGGFAFDSVVPGRYQLRVRRLAEKYQDVGQFVSEQLAQ